MVEDEDCPRAVLLASSDASPVAWVRLAAVEDGLGIERWLDLSLPKLLGDLRTLPVQELAWMDDGEWAGPHLLRRGFRELAEVITLTKTVGDVPQPEIPGVTLRPARKVDFAAIAAIDRAAFAPYWWRSAATVQRRATKASSFTVAERDDRVVGYAEWESHLPAAHLNRIAVDPGRHGRGIGGLLLRDTLCRLSERGVATLSLNTQRHNRRALRLYERFGFRPTGDAVTVWALQL